MKTNLDKYFKADEDLEKNGVWFNISTETGFLLRPFKATNPSVKAAMAKLYKPYSRQIEMGTLEDAKVLEINVKIFIQACLVDWKGVEIDGKVADCNPAVALEFFTGLPDLFLTLWNHTQDFKNFREDVGNF